MNVIKKNYGSWKDEGLAYLLERGKTWSQIPTANHVLPPTGSFGVEQKLKTKAKKTPKPYLSNCFAIYTRGKNVYKALPITSNKW